MKNSAIVLLSGGLDSTVLLYRLKSQLRYPSTTEMEFEKIIALSIYYGQRHSRELEFARKTCSILGVEHLEADLESISPLLKGSSQTDFSIPVPEGHYEAAQMQKTVVPNRNMIMLSVAGAAAISHDCRYIAYAAHAGDHAIYPDCREVFIRQMDLALGLCHYEGLDLLTPFVQTSKAGIVALGLQLKVPFENTWSCYRGGREHCGKCGTCVERREAFHLCGFVDPVPYACSLDETLALLQK